MNKALFTIFLLSFFIIVLTGCVINKNDDPVLKIYSPQNIMTSTSKITKDTPTTTNYCDCEKTFEKPIITTLSGKVIATFISGEAIGIEVFKKDDQYGQYYVEMPTGMNYNNINYDNVKIEGKMVGITCAYYNTVFGECVGDIIADSIEQSSIPK